MTPLNDQLEVKRKKFEEDFDNPLLDPDSPKYSSHEVNWVEDCKTWNEAKEKAKNFMNKEDRLVFVAHFKDTIRGKPQLIHRTIQTIPVLRNVEKNVKEKGEVVGTVIGKKFIDERFDKRYDGKELGKLVFDFFIYRIIDSSKEYFLLSPFELSQEYSEIVGMKIDVDDLSEISDSLRVGKLATLFIVKSSNPAVKIIPKDQLLSFVNEKKESNGWNLEGFQDYVFTHPNGNIYEYSSTFNKLRIAQFLSGKYEGYPLHLMKIGPVGTGKTTEAEAIDYKFKEELGILEAGTSRMKVLVPSFKEKPANLGYICNCNRVAIIDELMKMVSASIQTQHLDVNNYFGELNMLLEHKKRFVGSGNDNSTIVKTTSKVCITTNPIKGKNKLSQHLSVLDNTTISRMLIWIQDDEEVNKIYSKTGVRPSKEFVQSKSRECSLETKKNLENGVGDWEFIHGNSEDALKLYHDFLTIYDSCQVFLVEFDLERVKTIFKESVNLAREPMKQVWLSRGLHHSVLILDGLTKTRCLFKDQDKSFVANDSDYKELSEVINKMVLNWETNLERNWEGKF